MNISLKNRLMQRTSLKQSGFSLVELMVGLVIGLIATLVIMQVFSSFEGQKRSTTGTADAQTNGSIGLYNIQREVQKAGFGLPLFDANYAEAKLNNNINNFSALRCVSPGAGLPALPVDHDNLPAPGSPDVDALYPISITNGAAGASDTITVRYSTPVSGTVPIPTSIVAVVSVTELQISNNYGCSTNDIAVVVRNNGSCSSSRVTSTTAQLNANSTQLKLASVNAVQMPNGARLTCIGPTYSVVGFTVVGNELTRNGTPILSEIVSLQAQYGITGSTSAAIKSNQITQWVDAGALANPNRIRAIRVAVVARNNQLEKTNVTAAAPISWTGGPAINLSANADWQRYRYRVYEAIIPIRNLAFSGALL